ncbi:MAG: alpha/beta hydrolase [Candidatus Eremiobacteraeota bacterium]|nr:alpha/beta hydrolase [Candidatus Eremiobacteraeota bacterium]
MKRVYPQPMNAYTAYGDSRNPPLLFLHGIRLGREIWEPHATALADAYYVLTVDLPGHGALADVPFSVATVGALLTEIVDDVLARRPPVLIGYSLGGYVAMQFAHDTPERTSGVLLAGCTSDLKGWQHHPYDWLVHAANSVPSGVLRAAIAATFRVTLPSAVADTVIPLRFNASVFGDVKRAKTGLTSSELLRSYDKPVLIVNGQWDVFFRADEAKFAKAARAPVRLIRRSDHVAPLRKPHQFTALVRQFAERVYG